MGMLGGKAVLLLKFVIRRLVLVNRQFRFHWPDPIIRDAALPEGVVFSQVTHENVGLIREWKGALLERRFRVLLNRNHLGIYALSGNRVVGFLWLAINLGSTFACFQYDLIDVGEAISARSETRPEYRRKKIAFHVHAEMLELVRRIHGDHVTRIWGGTPTNNREMQDLASTLNCVRVQEQHVVAFLGLLFINRTWDLVPDTTRRSGSGRIVIRWRVPDLLYTPWVIRLWRGPRVRSLRKWFRSVSD